MDQKLKEFCRQIRERIYVTHKKAIYETEVIQNECYHPFIREVINNDRGSKIVTCRICNKDLSINVLTKQWEELLGDS